jgi:hypothetical protein
LTCSDYLPKQKFKLGKNIFVILKILKSVRHCFTLYNIKFGVKNNLRIKNKFWNGWSPICICKERTKYFTFSTADKKCEKNDVDGNQKDQSKICLLEWSTYKRTKIH